MASVITLAVTLSSCTKTEYIKPVLPLPELPVLPQVQAEQMQVLDDVSYTKLVRREQLLINHIGELRAIIETNNAD